MKPYCLVCDLDNTLIHSYRHRRDGDICVEHFQGREQSFMTKRSYELLDQLSKQIRWIPLTTRSIQQYRRIAWHRHTPPCAMVTNGAAMLCGEQADPLWCEQTRERIAPWQKKMLTDLAKQYAQKGGRMVDDVYFFIPFDDEESARRFSMQQRHIPLRVERSGRKVYILPPMLHKGTAVKRFRGNASDRLTILCAGDSTMDIPMLREADIALVPNETMAKAVTGTTVWCCPQNMIFSDFLLEQCLALIEA